MNALDLAALSPQHSSIMTMTDTEQTPKRARPHERTDERDIVLLCNPQAGGRWKELADILDSKEARLVRRIVTDSIEDVGPALSGLGSKTQLICVYGGDGTIQRILDRLLREPCGTCPALAFIGGGTMNIAAHWSGMSRIPALNFRSIVRAYLSGELLLKDVPLLDVRQGSQRHVGFTFGLGPIVRVLNEYEHGKKGRLAAVALAAKALTAAFSRYPASFQPLLNEMSAEIELDGEKLPYDRYVGLFCSITGLLNPIVQPFAKMRSRDTFLYAAYAVDRRELALLLPLLARGFRPIDSRALFKQPSTWKQLALAYLGRDTFPVDPRYANDAARACTVRSNEELYTVDGELLASNGEPISITLGPVIRLAVSPTVGLGPTMRLAADVTRLSSRRLAKIDEAAPLS